MRGASRARVYGREVPGLTLIVAFCGIGRSIEGRILLGGRLSCGPWPPASGRRRAPMLARESHLQAPKGACAPGRAPPPALAPASADRASGPPRDSFGIAPAPTPRSGMTVTRPGGSCPAGVDTVHTTVTSCSALLLTKWPFCELKLSKAYLTMQSRPCGLTVRLLSYRRCGDQLADGHRTGRSQLRLAAKRSTLQPQSDNGCRRARNCRTMRWQRRWRQRRK